MDPTEAMKWAVAITSILGGGAFGIKKLLTIWGKESAQSNGVSAANEIITSLREEIENSRKNAKYFSSEHEAAMLKIAALQRELTIVRAREHKIEVNNQQLLKLAQKNELLLDVDLTFSDTDIGKLT